jgi:hypothetical protein
MRSEEEERKAQQALIEGLREAEKRRMAKGRDTVEATLQAINEERRVREARSSTAWDYARAIDYARRGKTERLVDLFRARVVPEGKEWDLLAGFVLNRKPGGQVKEATHRIARVVLSLKEIGINFPDELLHFLCEWESGQSGEPVDPEAVRTLVRDPKRLQPKGLQHE